MLHDGEDFPAGTMLEFLVTAVCILGKIGEILAPNLNAVTRLVLDGCLCFDGNAGVGFALDCIRVQGGCAHGDVLRAANVEIGVTVAGNDDAEGLPLGVHVQLAASLGELAVVDGSLCAGNRDCAGN